MFEELRRMFGRPAARPVRKGNHHSGNDGRRPLMINKKVHQAMNEQIRHELESYYIYLSMAAWFHARNLDGMAHWMRCQAHEEMIHAMKFMDHILNRGGTVKLLDLKQIRTAWESVTEVWQDTLAHEQFITGKIHGIVKTARGENDFAADTLLNWFTKEQVEEEATAEKVLRQMERIGDTKEGLFMMDKELATRIFPAGSPLDPAAYNLVT
jgi:ferritin